MSDDLTVFGTDFTDVTGLKVKLTDNGYVKYVREGSRGGGNVTQDAQGRLVLSEGDNTIDGESDPIRFFDYDGTLIASYSSVPSSLPAVPTHEGLKNGTWNHNLQQVAAQVAATGHCVVGANYNTVSGATEIDIVLEDGRLKPYLAFAVDGTVSIDWGDNSTPSTVTGTSVSTGQTNISHEYGQAGNYTIKITLTSGNMYALYTSSTYRLLHNYSGTVAANNVYSNRVKSVRVGDDCLVSTYGLNYCENLESVSMPSGGKTTVIAERAFRYCLSLKFLAVPSGVTSIGENALQYCYSLEAVSIPYGVTGIGSNAFAYCGDMNMASIPSTVTSIGQNAFVSCYSLELATLPNGVVDIVSGTFSQCYSLTSVEIPDTVESIGSSAFQNCAALKSVTIPGSVTGIGTSAFQNCFSLETVHMSNGLTSIGDNAFYGCYSLESVTIPSGVTSIGARAFQDCRSIKQMNIPSGVTSIGSQAFSSCYGLESVSIPSTVTSIGFGCFNNCYTLRSIELPSGLTTISADKGSSTNGCFYCCYSLAKLTIPAGVTEITANEFGSCYGIIEYHFTRTESVPTLTSTNAFSSIQSNCKIYVPASKLDDYKTATNWSTYASKMVGE